MATISLCMIVKNEEDVLARCLDCVKEIADEIIIVDTGSEDGTEEIARRYTDRVYSFPWTDDFAAARNFSFSKAEMDYCMWLDADDVIEAADRKGLLMLKDTLEKDVDIVMMHYHTAFREDGSPAFSYYRERLIRNHAGYLWEGAIHEVISPLGKVIYAEPSISHRKLHPSDPDRNLRIFERLLADGKELDPRQQFYYARELYYHERHEDAIRVLEALLDKGTGWIENMIEACRHLSFSYAALGNQDEALRALLRSFEFDSPRAEVCCDLGKLFLDRGALVLAIYWYEQALSCERDDQGGGFVLPDCYDYLPCIQLCVCYDRLGDRIRAAAYNDRAEAFRPGDPACLYNRSYFARFS